MTEKDLIEQTKTLHRIYERIAALEREGRFEEADRLFDKAIKLADYVEKSRRN